MKNNTKKFTEKDLAYINDMFSWNLEALKLANHFMEEAEGEEVVEILQEVSDVHLENLNTCIKILEGNLEEDEECCDEENESYEENDEDEEDYEDDDAEEEEDEDDDEEEYDEEDEEDE